MKIYTKTGDKGTTMLFGGERVSKTSTRIMSLGVIDEVNSLLGIIVAQIQDKSLISKIQREQSNFLRLGADVATTFDVKPELQKHINRIKPEDVLILENEIDEWDKELTKLTQFILPGGTIASAFTHHARSVCRSAERITVELASNEEINPEVLKYLNRLSDWLFTLARYLNYKAGIEDVKYMG
jgi:cob(I)alamin adenosyltransferase